jgi:hypothetical protein
MNGFSKLNKKGAKLGTLFVCWASRYLSICTGLVQHDGNPAKGKDYGMSLLGLSAGKEET